MTIAIDRDRLVEWASRAIETPSFTGSEQALAELVAQTFADMGLQVLGGYGYTMEYDLQRHFRESRLGVIGAGTSDIQRNIIARALGL